MISEGALRLELEIAAGAVSKVQVSSSRRTDLSKLLEGRTIDEALKLLPSLFAVCGTAHTVAGLTACEEALGVEVSESQREARALLSALEAVDNHAFQICVDWQQLTGRPAATRELKQLRAATEALRRWTFDEPFGRVGGAKVSARWVLKPKLNELSKAMRVLAPESALYGPDDLGDWLRHTDSPSSFLLKQVIDAGVAGFGRSNAPLLPPLDARWFARHFRSPGFSAQPDLEGQPAEAGAVSQAAQHPAVKAHLAQHGLGLLTRLIARLAALSQLGAHIEATAQSLRPAKPQVPQLRVHGTGTGVADTSRGRLAHQVELNGGKIARWLTVAPTEWSFHPQGLLQQALLHAPAPDLQRNTQWLVAALDPCVACTVHVTGTPGSHA